MTLPRRLRDLGFLISLAFKNLTRHKRRTVITASSLAVGLAIYTLLTSLLTGLEQDGVRNLVWYETGAAQIQAPGWWEDKLFMPLEKGLRSTADLMVRLESAGFPAAPRTQFSGELIVTKDPYPESGFSRAIFLAVTPSQDARVFRVQETLSAGRWLETGEEGVVIGSAMADQLGAQVGWPVTIKTRTLDGLWQTMDFPVVGIVRTPNALVNRMHVYLDREVAGQYLMLGETDTYVSVGTQDWEDEKDLRAVLEEAAGPDLRVLTWKTLGADFLTFVQSRSSLSLVILFLVGVIAAVGVSNTMLLTILERTRELGMLRAQGMSDGEIMAGLLLESGAIGVVGAGTGLVIGTLLNIPLTTTGIDLTGFLQSVNVSLPFSGILRGAWTFKAYPAVLLAGVGLSMAVSIIPVRHALRQEITEALRHT